MTSLSLPALSAVTPLRRLRRQARPRLEQPTWHTDRQLGEDKDMRHDAERAIRLGRPIAVYPIMEIALRHQLGLGVEEHLNKISQLWADLIKLR